MKCFSLPINLIKFLAVNEASLMMRGGGGNSQIYRVPSFGDPFDNEEEVCEKREKIKEIFFLAEVLRYEMKPWAHTGKRPLEQPTKQQLCRRFKTPTPTNAGLHDKNINLLVCTC